MNVREAYVYGSLVVAGVLLLAAIWVAGTTITEKLALTALVVFMCPVMLAMMWDW